jgi:hypothetical protein
MTPVARGTPTPPSDRAPADAEKPKQLVVPFAPMRCRRNHGTCWRRTGPPTASGRQASRRRLRKRRVSLRSGETRPATGIPARGCSPREEGDLVGDLAGEAHLVDGDDHRHPSPFRSRTAASTSPTSSGSRALATSLRSRARGGRRRRGDRDPLLLAAEEVVGPPMPRPGTPALGRYLRKAAVHKDPLGNG